MAITRVWQSGFEANGLDSEDEVSGISAGASVTVSNAFANTGTYSMRVNSSHYFWQNVPATTQVRAGMFFYIVGAITAGNLFQWHHAGAALGQINSSAGGGLALYIGGVLKDTALGVLKENKWMHLGLDAKRDGAAGWGTIYLDGVEILTFTGNTGAADIVKLQFGPASGSQTYWDDCFIDDTSGEVDAIAPDKRFPYFRPDGIGNYSQQDLIPDTGEDNWEDVDEVPHDSDTSYVFATALNERDTYTMADYSLPSGATIDAVIGYAYARKTNAGVATQLALACRENATDATGSDQDLATTYGAPLWERWTTAPDTDPWDEATWNATEIGQVGRGAF